MTSTVFKLLITESGTSSIVQITAITENIRPPYNSKEGTGQQSPYITYPHISYLSSPPSTTSNRASRKPVAYDAKLYKAEISFLIEARV